MIGGIAFAALLAPGSFSEGVQLLAQAFLSRLGFAALLVPLFALLFCAALLVLPQGRRKIGGQGAKAEFSLPTWVAMMFAAGMGSGLVFWGAAEPLIHSLSPPPGEGILPSSDEARLRALALTQFHWGLSAWAVYAVAAIAVGLGFSSQRPLLPSSAFGSLSPRARRGIDLLALFAVLFGLVASMGQTVFQIAAGLGIITGGDMPSTLGTELLVLAALGACYLASTWAGLRRGIALLSNINMALAGLLVLFIFASGPTAAMLEAMADSAWGYLKALPELSVKLREEGAPRQWTEDWTLVYFLWWIAWTPFVGVFLARISRGRSLRAFVLAAVAAPFLLTLIWFSVLGGAALELERLGTSMGVGDFAAAPQATYRLLAELPWSFATQALTILLVSIFLITSADSGAYVLAMFSEASNAPAIAPRLFWGLVLAVLTAGALLSDSGQNVMRAMAVAGAIPLTFLLFAQGAAAAFTLVRGDRPHGP